MKQEGSCHAAEASIKSTNQWVTIKCSLARAGPMIYGLWWWPGGPGVALVAVGQGPGRGAGNGPTPASDVGLKPSLSPRGHAPEASGRF